MPSFGEKLRLEREKRKITLEQIAATTKIGTRMLQALEDEKFSQLPGGIFNKGFVRAYARAIGIDEEQTVADYLEASGEGTPPKPDADLMDALRDPASHKAQETDQEEKSHDGGRLELRAELASRQLPWGLFAVILLVIALALSLWTHYRRGQQPSSEPSPQPTSQSASQSDVPPANSAPAATAPAGASSALPQSFGTGQAGSATATTSSPAKPLPVKSSPASPSGGTDSSGASVAAKSAPAQSAEKLAPTPTKTSTTTQSPTPAKPAQSASTSGDGGFIVVVEDRQESWMSVVVDGTPMGSTVLQPGERRAYHGHKSVVVKAGNAAGLDVQFNGKRLPVGGEPGQVRTLTFGPDGLVQPAPAPVTP